MNPLEKLLITTGLVQVIGKLDEFKGRWEALGTLAPERLTAFARRTLRERGVRGHGLRLFEGP